MKRLAENFLFNLDGETFRFVFIAGILKRYIRFKAVNFLNALNAESHSL
jgi:hypothetical protein